MYGKSVENVWQIYGKVLRKYGECMDNEMNGKCMDNEWKMYGKCMENGKVWEKHEKRMGEVW